MYICPSCKAPFVSYVPGDKPITCFMCEVETLPAEVISVDELKRIRGALYLTGLMLGNAEKEVEEIRAKLAELQKSRTCDKAQARRSALREAADYVRQRAGGAFVSADVDFITEVASIVERL